MARKKIMVLLVTLSVLYLHCVLTNVLSAQQAAAKNETKKLPPRLRKNAVLTIGEMDGFLEAGGIFNFVVEKKKVRFEVNLTAAEQAKIKIRSKLLRLAKRVIKPKPKDEQDNQNARRHSDRRVTRADRREAL